MQLFRKYAFLLLTVVLCSCSKGNLDVLGIIYTISETPDERFTQSEEYNALHPFDTIHVAAEAYRVYCMTDVHVDKTTLNLDTFCMRFMAEAQFAATHPGEVGAAPFCIALGDLINAVDNYPMFMGKVDEITAAGYRMYATPGNHDIYYDQWSLYRSYWHTSHFCVVVRTPSGQYDLFIFLDTASAQLGKLQRDWLKTILKEAQTFCYRHIVVATHTHFWKIDQSQSHTSEMPIEETYELADIFSRYGVDLVLQGHSHCRNLQVYKNVQYLRLDALEDHYYNAHYLVLELNQTNTTNNGITWMHIPVGPQDPTDPYRPVE